jgi:hypothetical protein
MKEDALKIDEIRLEILDRIRKASQEGRLIETDEILSCLDSSQNLKLAQAHNSSFWRNELEQIILAHNDIKTIVATNRSPMYYSSISMTDQYAEILSRKEEDSLLAEIVRENSAVYPRPVPLDLFMDSPFDLTHEQIMQRLLEMERSLEYQDIARTITSVGTVFLYSKRHLDPFYASCLAEWLDVGEAGNP